MVIGQLLMIAFSIFYGFVSYHTHYYGEMITYLGMTLPLAVMSTISWLRHPYRDTEEVEVSRVSTLQSFLLPCFSLLVTVAFYFILGALHTANLLVSTLSVATSFFAAYLTFLRSPFYALAYASNDLVLITLWILAAVADLTALPMVICFSVFFFNDVYVFISWKRMAKRQHTFMEHL
jgi:nicotinamide mononucleotide transporter PnuC